MGHDASRAAVEASASTSTSTSASANANATDKTTGIAIVDAATTNEIATTRTATTTIHTHNPTHPTATTEHRGAA
jgi:hypothetical protein